MKNSFYLFFLVFSLVFGCRFLKSDIILTFGSGGELSEREKVKLSQFEEENPGIKIQAVKLNKLEGLNQHDSYVTYLATGEETVDVFSIDVVWVSEFASSGWILELDRFFGVDELNKFIPSSIEGGRYQSRLYAIPGNIDAGLIYYNKKLLRKKGISNIQKKVKNWNDLFRIASKFGRYGFVYQAKSGESLMCNFLEHFSKYKKNQKGIIDLLYSKPSDWKKALKSFKQPAKRRITSKKINKMAEPESAAAFLTGKYAFMRNWPYMLHVLRNKKWKWNKDFGLLDFPRRPTLGGWYLVANKNSRHAEAAIKLLKFLVKEKIQRKYFLESDNFPSILSLYKDKEILKKSPELKTLIKLFKKARPRDTNERYYEFSKISSRFISEYLKGKINAKSVISGIKSHFSYEGTR